MKNPHFAVSAFVFAIFAFQPTPAGAQKSPAPPQRATSSPTLEALAAAGKVKIDSAGTGETIGHVLDLKIENLTDQSIKCDVGPMVLESRSRKNQDYVCPTPQTVTINPHGTATVPVNGVCINRNKPPVSKGAPGDLVVNTGDPTLPQNPNSHLPANQVGDLLRICTAKYDAANQLQKSGALKNLPYHDPQKQKDIVVQWSTWCDPRISQVTGAPPATKEDLKKVVYKQLETKRPMSPETKKKVDQGIDTIFEKVELTTAKAKDLEKPETYAQTQMSAGTFETSGQQPTPAASTPPQTQEKPQSSPPKTAKPGPFFKPGTGAKPPTVAQPGERVHVEDVGRVGEGPWRVKITLRSGETVWVSFETADKPPLKYCDYIRINKTHTDAEGGTVIDDYIKNPSPTPTSTATPRPTATATQTPTSTPAPTPTATQPPTAPQPPQPPSGKTEAEQPKGEAVTQPTPTEPPFELPDWLKKWWKFLKPGWEAAKTGTGMVPTDLPEGKDALGGVIAKLNVKIREECAKDPNGEKCEFYQKFRDKLVDIYNSIEDKD